MKERVLWIKLNALGRSLSTLAHSIFFLVINAVSEVTSVEVKNRVVGLKNVGATLTNLTISVNVLTVVMAGVGSFSILSPSSSCSVALEIAVTFADGSSGVLSTV